MTTADDFERHVHDVASHFAFVRVTTVDKTDYAIKLQLDIATDCFVQVYANLRKQLLSYALVLNRKRIYGRDCDGGRWHLHPYENAESHDFGPEGAKVTSLEEFLGETQRILAKEGLL